jgi:hypothetical protein
MLKPTSLALSGTIAAILLATPLLAQSDANRPADTASTQRTDDRHDRGFDMGWLGLIGLAGLLGLKRKSPETVSHTSEGNARTYPSKA